MVTPALGPWISESLQRPFDRGGNNCALWMADAVAHCTGHDPAADLRGRIASWQGWLDLLRRRGGLLAVVAERMDAAPVLRPWQAGRPGDAACVLRWRGVALCGLVSGGRVLARTERGLGVLPPETIIRGWTW